MTHFQGIVTSYWAFLGHFEELLHPFLFPKSDKHRQNHEGPKPAKQKKKGASSSPINARVFLPPPATHSQRKLQI
jgi:hypothetical protein